MTTKKVSFLIQDLFQQGAQYVTAMMIRGFIEHGYNVDLLLSQVHNDRKKRGEVPFSIPDNVNIIMLPSRRARYNIIKLNSYIRHTDSQALICMCTPYLLPLALASVGAHEIKICYVEHNGFNPNNKKHGLLKRAINSFQRKRYDCFMGVSRGSARLLEKMLDLTDNTVKVVYNPVIDNIYWDKLKKETNHQWLVKKDVPTIISAGAFSRVKDHLTLFEAIKLANKVTPVRLILYGKGKMYDTYNEWIERNGMLDCISLAGHSDNLPAELKAADAFVVSSLVESFSVVIVEAMAANVPVISTDCPFGPPELLKNGEYGKLVPVSDSKAMADAIISQINQPTPPAPKAAWEQFTIEKIVYAYETAIGLNTQDNAKQC